jgi:sulfur relay protein TusC/DsrF
MQNFPAAILFISSRAPWSSGAPLACLEALMTTAVFDVPARLLLLGEGVWQLAKAQDGTALGSRNVSRMFGALGLYGINEVHVDGAALARYGLARADLLDPADCEAPLALHVTDDQTLGKMLAASTVVFNF